MTARRTIHPPKNRPDLDRLVRESASAFEAMTAERQEALLREQQKSFARQDKD